MRLSLVVPVYNEATRLRVSEFLDFLIGNPTVDILFVDDGSTDATGKVLAELADAAGDQVDLLLLDANHGKAEAVRRGLSVAVRKDVQFVGFIDGDLAAPLDEVIRLIAVLEQYPDTWVALASRVRLLGREIERSPVRHILGRVFATAASLVLALPVYDTQCGLKIMRVNPAVIRCLQQPFRTKWLFDVELLARLKAVVSEAPISSRFREVPLESWRDQAGSHLRPADFLRAPVELLAIRRSIRKES